MQYLYHITSEQCVTICNRVDKLRNPFPPPVVVSKFTLVDYPQSKFVTYEMKAQRTTLFDQFDFVIFPETRRNFRP